MRKEASTRPSPILCSIYFPPAEDKLKEAGVDVHAVFKVKSFQVKLGSRWHTVQPRGGNAGYYFIAPGRAPRIEYGVEDTGGILDFARDYFHLPQPLAPPPPELRITAQGAGDVKMAMTRGEILRLFPPPLAMEIDTRTPEIRIFAAQSTNGIALRIFLDRNTQRIAEMDILDHRFKTDANLGPGSTFGDLLRSERNLSLTGRSDAWAVSSASGCLTYQLTVEEPPPAASRPRNTPNGNTLYRKRLPLAPSRCSPRAATSASEAPSHAALPHPPCRTSRLRCTPRVDAGSRNSLSGGRFGRGVRLPPQLGQRPLSIHPHSSRRMCTHRSRSGRYPRPGDAGGRSQSQHSPLGRSNNRVCRLRWGCPKQWQLAAVRDGSFSAAQARRLFSLSRYEMAGLLKRHHAGIEMTVDDLERETAVALASARLNDRRISTPHPSITWF